MRLEHAVWGAREWRAALCASADAPARLCDELSRRYGAPVLATNAARVGLQLALQVLAQREPSRGAVLLPAYICPAVIDAVRAAGLQPVFAAVGPELNLDVAACEQALARHRVLAVVVAHMYACPALIDDIHQRCRKAGVFLIDDAAHAPGVVSAGQLLGRRGEVGLVSFAQSKTITTGVRGSGGVLIVNDPQLVKPLARLIERLPQATHRRAALLHFVTDYLGPRALALLGYYAGRLIKPSPRDWFQPQRISPMEAAIALAQLTHLDDIIAARVRVIAWFGAQLGGIAGVEFPQYAPGRYLSRVMVRVGRADVRARLAREGVASRTGYSTVAGHLLELPLAVTMCAGEVASVCDSLSRAIHHANSCDPIDATSRVVD